MNKIFASIVELIRLILSKVTIKTDPFEIIWEDVFSIDFDPGFINNVWSAIDGKSDDDEEFGDADQIEFNLIPPLYKFYQSRKMYNQLDTGKMDCTIYAALTAYSNLINKEINLETRQKLKKLALEGGLSEKNGWYLYKAVDLITKFYTDVRSYTVPTNSDRFMKVLKKGYCVITGYRGNKKYNDDVEDNAQIDLESIGDATYGHAICLTLLPGTDYICAIDNYNGVKKYNVYKIKTFQKLFDNGVFFKNSFYFTLK